MPVVAHGVDLVYCPRIRRIWTDHGTRFLERVYTAAERAHCLECKDPVVRLAGRFAVKEAVMKVLGTGWRGGVEWADIETLPDPLGKPLVTLHGRTAALAEVLGIEQILISISHSGDYALASALGIGPAGASSPSSDSER
jgi:holo-[acyl-carrier protein] synthase